MENCFLSGKIFTNNPELPWAEAILTEKGKIKAVGSNEYVQKIMSSNASVTNLAGQCVLPGFTDSHCHLLKRGQTLKFVDLNNTKSIEECRSKIKETVKKCKKGQWIQGFGWNENLWQENRLPNKEDLDDIVPDNPIMLIRVCIHSVWVNSLALKMANIDSTTPHPPGGTIEKHDKTLAPTGIVKEANYLFENLIEAPSKAELKEAALAAQDEALKFGITSIHSHETIQSHDTLKQLEKENKLKLKIFHSFVVQDIDKLKQNKISPDKGSDNIWYGHIKLFADGSLGSGTAYMHEPYENDTSCGLPFFDIDELSEYVEKAHSMGFGAAIHAIGDKAVSNCLEAIKKSRHRDKKAVNDRIEHIQLFKSSDLDLFLEYEVYASVQPIFVQSDMDLAQRVWGKKRCENAYAWKSIIDHGIPIVFGSDSPIESCNPILGIHAAINRTKSDDTPKSGWFENQKLSLEQSLKGYTPTPAQLSGRQNLMGSIEKGKFADFIVLDNDIFTAKKDSIKNINVIMTIVNGEIVYQTNYPS